jgi:hypothetical protein
VRLALAAVAGLCAVVVPAAAATPPPRFTGCRSFVSAHPVALVRPRSLVVACGDGNFYVTGIAWTSWGARGASGTGTGRVNDCTPYCAAGHFHAYPVALSLRTAASCARRFTRLAWRFPLSRPSGSARSGAVVFRCR